MTAITSPAAVYHHKRGRPRKLNVKRTPKGKSLGEIVDLTAVFEQPHRRGFKNPQSELLGYPLGRLRATGQVSELQHRAGNEWATLVRAYAFSIGAKVGSPKSGSDLGCISGGGTIGAMIDDDEYDRRVGALRDRYNACFERVSSLGRSFGRGNAMLVAARRVCIEERYPSDEELGDLRLALNALSVELKIGE